MTQVDAAGIAAAEARFAEWFGLGRAPGLAWGIVADGGLVHTGGLGEQHVGAGDTPDAMSAFRIASMTKSFVAAMILLLRDEGRLRLDDPVALHVPELVGVPRATTDSPPTTLRDLLAMRSGYPEDDPWADRLEGIGDDEHLRLAGGQLTHARAPGVAFDYSNLGFTLLGQVVAAASGRPFRAFVEERLLEPLGLAATGWGEGGAPGYHRVDDAWVEQPPQESGAFSPLGGLHSTVADLAVWVHGFADAFPPRDGADAHPLARASRREMQQVVTALPLQAEAGHPGPLGAHADGYCLGLMSRDDLRSGRTVGHSGGYPGYGSHMRWHPATGIGVIALANGRYARPAETAAAVLEDLVRRAPARAACLPHPAFAEVMDRVDAALAAGDLARLEPLLAPNVALDEALERRAARIAALPAAHGALRRSGTPRVATPTEIAWLLEGERGSVAVAAMLTPEHPPRLQRLDVESIAEPTPVLLAALAAADLGDLAHAALPARTTTWVACDGERTGTALIEGPHVDVRIAIDLDADPVQRVTAEERYPAPW